MACGNTLHIPYLEVSGNVKWTSTSVISHDPKLHPGRLCISTLADAFYFQLIYDHNGKKSKLLKLSSNIIEKVSCRGGRFTCYFRNKDTGTSFILSDGENQKLENFTKCLLTLKSGERPDVKPSAHLKTPQKGIKCLPSSPAVRKTPNHHQNGIEKNQLGVDKSVRKSSNDVTEIDLCQLEEKSSARKRDNSFTRSPRTPKEQNILYRYGQDSSVKKDLFDSEKKKRQKAVKLRQDSNKENSQHSQLGDFLTFGSSKKRPLNERVTQDVITAGHSPYRHETNSFYGSSGQSRRVLLKKKDRETSRTTPRKSLLSNSTNSLKESFNSVNSHNGTHSAKSYLQSGVTLQGFPNLGNTCYMNSTLQSLLGLVPFVQDLGNKDVLEFLNPSTLGRCMYNLYRCKDDFDDSNKRNCLQRLKDRIIKSEMTERFSGYRQNDAHEFMNICLDQIKEELRKAILATIPMSKQNDLQTKLCPITRNFEGSFRKSITCTRCGDMVTKDEIFNHLSLNIPQSEESPSMAYSLNNLLYKCFSEEEVERKCDTCQCTSAVHSFKIQALPRIMIFHMLRSGYRRSCGTQEKKSDKIQSSRYIDMGEFCHLDVKSPPGFTLRNINSPFVPTHYDNETPTSDIDDFVVKPRRRLDMSNCGTPASSVKPTENSTSYSRTPRLSSELEFDSQQLSHMSMEDQIKLATLESLEISNAGTESMSYDQKLKQATLESLQTKRQEDGLMHNWGFDLAGFDGISDAELLQVDEQCASEQEKGGEKRLENQVVPDSGTTKENASVEGGTVRSQYSRFDHIRTGENLSTSEPKNAVSNDNLRKRVCSVSDTPALNESVNVESSKSRQSPTIQSCGDSVMKRRKVDNDEKTHPKENGDMFVLVDESDQLERVLEESRNNDVNNSAKKRNGKVTQRLADSDANKENAETREEKSNLHYRLVSVVNHLGSNTESGHYTSDVLNLKSDQWIRFDDVHSEMISEHQVRYNNSADSYIYFYMHKSLTEQLLPPKSTRR